MTTDNKGATITPASSRYFMPAEWEPHEATWLQWPSNRVEPGYEMKQERTWLEMVAALFEHEKVSTIVGTSRQRDHVAYLLDYFGIGHDNIDLHIIQTNGLWARDNGPIFLINKQGDLAISNWRFNGWGDRFVSDPYGHILAQASQGEDEVLVCRLDLSFIEEIRAGYSFPFRDRRVDSYDELSELYIG